MLVFYSIIFGLIQGLTEFLPVSSSGHLVILHDLIKIDLVDELSFDVALHLGTLFALLLFFLPDIIKLAKGFFTSLVKHDFRNNLEQRLPWMILFATLPVVLAGYYLEGMITLLLRSVNVVAILLIVFGLLFFFYENLGTKTNTLNDLSFGQAFKIGVAQVFALVPGVSRSGITIIAGLGENLKREEAARFSFLLSIPAVLGATAKKTTDMVHFGLLRSEAVAFVVAVVVSFIVGYLAIKFLLKYLSSHSLNAFAWYRIILGAIILLIYHYG